MSIPSLKIPTGDAETAPARPHPTKEEAALEQAATSRCLVYCRLRPDKKDEFVEPGLFPLLTLSNRSVAVKDEKTYDFDGTFGQASQQDDVFNTVARPCLQHALAGFRAALMCYGQTGTGKTFTMCGPGRDPGIVPKAARFLFDSIAADTEREYEVEGQFLQIYRDHLGDLMQPTGREKVDIFFDKHDGVTLPGCSSHTLTSAEQFMALFEEGNARRVTTATAMNPESSRGHSALVVWVTSRRRDDDASAERCGKITFIDLAGYERFSKTGISNANPVMKDEARTINASLLSLGHVVSSLSNGDKHIPWRNSKLTRLLQDSIGGRSRTSIVLTVGPSSDHLFESTNTLQFGQRAMAVKVSAKVTEVVDFERLAKKLQGMLDEKQERIDSLEVQVTMFEAQQQDLIARHGRDAEQLRREHDDELLALKGSGAGDERVANMLRQHEVEQENMLTQQQEELQYEAEAHQRRTVELADDRQHEAELQWTEQRLALEATIRGLRERLGDDVDGDGGKQGDDGADVPTAKPRTARSQALAESADTAALLAALREAEAEAEGARRQHAEAALQLQKRTAAGRAAVQEIAQLRAALTKARGTEEDATAQVVSDLEFKVVDAAELAAVRATLAAEVEAQELVAEELRAQLAEAHAAIAAHEPSPSLSPERGVTFGGHLTARLGGSTPPMSARAPMTARRRRGVSVAQHRQQQDLQQQQMELQQSAWEARIEQLEGQLNAERQSLAEAELALGDARQQLCMRRASVATAEGEPEGEEHGSLEAFRNEIADLNDELDDTHRALEDAQEQRDAARKESASAAATLGDVMAKLRAAIAARDEAEAAAGEQHTLHQQETTALAAQIEQLTAAKAEAEAQVAEMEERGAAMETAARDARVAAEEQHQLALADSAARLESLEDRAVAAEAAGANAEASGSEQVTTLEAEVAALRCERDALQVSLAESEATAVRLGGELEAARANVADPSEAVELEATIAELSAAKAEAEAQVAEMEERGAAMETAAEDARVAAEEQHQLALADSAARIEALEATVAAAEKAATESVSGMVEAATVEHLTQDLEEARRALEERDADATSLGAKAAALEAQIAELQTAAAAPPVPDTTEDSVARADAAEAKVASLEAALAEAQRDAARARKAADDEAADAAALPSDMTELRQHALLLERLLRARCEESNRHSARHEMVARQVRQLGEEPLSGALPDVSTRTATGKPPPREIAAIETALDTSDLQIVIDCKEAELRVVAYRLEQRELATAQATDTIAALRQYSADLHAVATELLEASTATATDAAPRVLPAAPQLSVVDGDGEPRVMPLVDAPAAAREQLESMLHVMKALRKQNSVLHTVLCERGMLLRHYAWMLVQHQVLPSDFDINAVAGDQTSELRLAFAERDEEIFLKDQALMLRSSEVIVLEEAVAELHQQIAAAGLDPVRPISRFAAAAVESRQQTQRDMNAKEESRAKLQERHQALLEELSNADGLLQACTAQERTLQEATDGAATDAERAELEGQLAAVRRDVVELRMRKDQLANAVNLVDAQCAAQEQEVVLLRRVLQQSTKLMLDMQEKKDMDEKLSFFGKLKGRWMGAAAPADDAPA